MNCLKCKKPIKSGTIAVRLNSVHLAHAECATGSLGYYENDELKTETFTFPSRSEERSALDPQVFKPNGPSKANETVWLQTYLGGQLRIPEWNHDAICLEETATVLSRICRFGGRTIEPYMVSEHSVRVAYCVEALGGSALEQFQAINHEGDEALLGFDPPAPLLQLLPDLKVIKRLAHESYMRRYGLPVDLPVVVKRADLILLATEKRDLMRPEPRRWMELPDPLPGKISPWPNPYQRFVAKWRELAKAVGYVGVE